MTTTSTTDLPPELWSRIFASSITIQDDFYIDLPEPHIENPPLLLGRVSRRWREMSLSCSELWSALSITVSNDSIARGQLEGIESWLVHAQGQPLKIAFWSDGASDSGGNEFMRRVVWKNLRQTRTLFIRMSGGWDEPWLSPPIVDVLPLLEGLQFYFRTTQYSKWLRPILCAKLPSLRRLMMQEYVIGSDPPHLPLGHHLASLTHLDAATNNFDGHPLHILEQCRNLESFFLNFASRLARHTPQTVFDGHVTLHRLKVLRLRDKTSLAWEDLFAVSTFPALEEIEIVGTVWPVCSLIPFMDRSCCRIRSLKFYESNISEDHLVTLLRAPQVQYLKILKLSVKARAYAPFHTLPISDAFIRSLDPSHTGNALLPRLETIEVNGMWSSALPWVDGVFADMIAARCRRAEDTSEIVMPLDVALYSNTQAEGAFHLNDFERLRVLQMKGLTVALVPDTW